MSWWWVGDGDALKIVTSGDNISLRGGRPGGRDVRWPFFL